MFWWTKFICSWVILYSRYMLVHFDPDQFEFALMFLFPTIAPLLYICSNYDDKKKICQLRRTRLWETPPDSLFLGDQKHPLFPNLTWWIRPRYFWRKTISCVNVSWKRKKLDRKCKRRQGVQHSSWEEFFGMNLSPKFGGFSVFKYVLNSVQG